MVRAHGRALLRDVVGAGRTSPDGARGDRTAAPPPAARAERPCLWLGGRSLRNIMERGALRMSEGLRTMIPIQPVLAQPHMVVRLDMTMSVVVTLGLLLWLMWH